MPILEMHLMEGRTEEQKQHAATAITEALVGSLGVKPQSVRILITEHKNDQFYVAGERIPVSRGALDEVGDKVVGE
ncbi:MAG: tautomerase family protein [Gammaproteobacteria bacterium]|nr:tautomerase family protein [Gammaproteobacteria bacterium]